MRSNWVFMDRLKPVECTNVSMRPFFNIGHARKIQTVVYRLVKTISSGPKPYYQFSPDDLNCIFDEKSKK